MSSVVLAEACVILDSTAAFSTLTPDEIQALQTYLEQGHTLLGEDTILQWSNRHSNNGLAPLFGLAEQSTLVQERPRRKVPALRAPEQDPDAAVLLRDVANPMSAVSTAKAEAGEQVVGRRGPRRRQVPRPDAKPG